MKAMTREEWHAEGVRRFGSDVKTWRFVCPSCGHVASVADWLAVGATKGEIAFSCVGRHMSNAADMCTKPGPCNYAGGGLFKLNPLDVDGERYFDFAPAGDRG